MSVLDEFNIFWRTFPRHVGKLAAQKAYEKARTMATAQQILDGVEAYKHHKPAYADWCHARTFLTQGRWLDSADAAPPARAEWVCPHVPHCLGRSACETLKVCGR